jgi:hypothetical protein
VEPIAQALVAILENSNGNGGGSAPRIRISESIVKSVKKPVVWAPMLGNVKPLAGSILLRTAAGPILGDNSWNEDLGSMSVRRVGCARICSQYFTALIGICV